MNKLFNSENILLFVVSIIVLLITNYYHIFNTELTDTVNNIIAINAGLMALLLAAVALLYAFGNNLKIKRIKKSTKYQDLLQKYTDAIFLCGFIILTGIIIQATVLTNILHFWITFSIIFITYKVYNVIKITKTLIILS